MFLALEAFIKDANSLWTLPKQYVGTNSGANCSFYKLVNCQINFSFDIGTLNMALNKFFEL